MCAIPEVVILNNILDAHKLLLLRRYLLQKCVVVAVDLIAAAGNFVMVVAVLRYEDSNDLVSDEVLPICASHGAAVAEHNPGRGEVRPRMVQQHLDLRHVSSCFLEIQHMQHTEWCLSPSTVSVAELSLIHI